MTRHSAEKRAARLHARDQGVPYRRAREIVRGSKTATIPDETYVHRLLIEAVEGCGIRHWATIVAWDGDARAIARDVGGEEFLLNTKALNGELREYRRTNPSAVPTDIDSYDADEMVQKALFGGVIYRTGIRRRQ